MGGGFRVRARGCGLGCVGVAGLEPGNYGPRASDRRSRGEGLGRRQAVRQRILIPPYGGSNPPAPAPQSRYFGHVRFPGKSPGIPGLCVAKTLRGDQKTRMSDQMRHAIGPSLWSRFPNVRNLKRPPRRPEAVRSPPLRVRPAHRKTPDAFGRCRPLSPLVLDQGLY